jgi:hypothetical protein
MSATALARSTCCVALAHVAGDTDGTRYYVCTRCGNPCSVYPNQSRNHSSVLRLGDAHTEPSRQGMRRLLDHFPEAIVADVDAQWQTESNVAGPWILVTLQDHPNPYAILKSTGNVYRMHSTGAVDDDPFIVITISR